MKKIVLLLTLLTTLSVNALELDIDMGTGIHYAGSNGKLVYKKDFWKDSSGDIDHETSANFYTWIEISSDQAYWPKLRLETTQLKTEGKSLVHIAANGTVNTAIDAIENTLFININDTFYDSRLTMNTYEAFAFYEYFEESDTPSLGLGIGVKKFAFDYAVTIIDGLQFNDTGGDLVPMLFFKTRHELDEKNADTKLAVQAEMKLYVFGDSNIYDYLIKVDFLMKYNETTDIGVEMGYKETFFDIKGADIANVGGDMTSKGVYFGLVAHFR